MTVSNGTFSTQQLCYFAPNHKIYIKMVTIYQDYDDEPEDVFLPIPDFLAAKFYALEMDNYREDINFFEKQLPPEGAILELGCGTGRIIKKLVTHSSPNLPNHPKRQAVGIDISVSMLQLAILDPGAKTTNVSFFCMDMLRLAFSMKFAAILIPYNTLNLLSSEEEIICCLDECKNVLQPSGKILLQLFIPTTDFIKQKKSFQFQMFDRPKGGKIIKEILRHYEPKSQTVSVEERYRVRPMHPGLANEDWKKEFSITGYSADKWLSLFSHAGFTPTHTYSDYNDNPGYDTNSSIFLTSLTCRDLHNKKYLLDLDQRF